MKTQKSFGFFLILFVVFSCTGIPVSSAADRSSVDYTGWWYDAAAEHSGTGVSLELQNNEIYLAVYDYRADGTPVWYAGQIAQGAPGEFSGALKEYSGWPLVGGDPASGLSEVQTGTVSVSFSSESAGSLTWSLGGTEKTLSLTRYMDDIAPGTPDPRGINGWYYDPASSGMGWFLEAQGDTIFIGWYHYNGAGNARWWVSDGWNDVGGFPSGAATYSGTWNEFSRSGRDAPPMDFSLIINGTDDYTLNWNGTAYALQSYIFSESSGCDAPVYPFAGEPALQAHNTLGTRHSSVVKSGTGTETIELGFPKTTQQDEVFVYFHPESGADPYTFPYKQHTYSFGPAVNTDDYNDTSLFLDTDMPGTYELYRAFSFPAYLTQLNGTQLPDNSEKLIILLHGWNYYKQANPYEEMSEWKVLADALQNNAANYSDWRIVGYNWAASAATGGIFSDGNNENARDNGSQAAEIAHQHGRHIGKLIYCNYKGIKKVQFIAHSAGTWAARAATRYLAENSSADIQITLLDPYIPGQAGSTGDFRIDYVNGIDDWNYNPASLNLLENYYTSSAVDPLTLGTSSTFTWRTQDINHAVDQILVYMTHCDPLKWYGDSINAAYSMINTFSKGWVKSMAFNE